LIRLQIRSFNILIAFKLWVPWLVSIW
jgi:hypothetical protein